jgi:hypothetical protein
MLLFGIDGIAFRSFGGRPMLRYWQILLPLFVMRIVATWRQRSPWSSDDR